MNSMFNLKPKKRKALRLLIKKLKKNHQAESKTLQKDFTKSSFTYGIGVTPNAYENITIEASNTTIAADGGVTVNGTTDKTKTYTRTITLKDVILNTPGIGIYQAGRSTFEVTNPTIDTT